jgi:hypothetical protein
MRWVAVVDHDNEVGPFPSLSPYSSSPHSRSWHRNKEGKSEWQGKETVHLTRAYIARTARRTGKISVDS